MIHIITGNTGAGKTTYAMNLKSEVNGVLFSIDKWNKELFIPDRKDGDDLNWFLERINRAEAIIQDLVIQLDIAGVDAILDLGFSKMEHRENFYHFAETNYIPYTLHFLDVPKEERVKRIQNRNLEKGPTFEIEVTTENIEFMESWFQELTKEELAIAHIKYSETC